MANRGRSRQEEEELLKAHFFHINNVEKLPRLQETLTTFLSHLDDDAVVSMNTTEVGPAGSHDFYSYTVALIFKTKQEQ